MPRSRRSGACGISKVRWFPILAAAIVADVYTNSHLEYVAEVLIRLHRNRESLRGVRIVRQAPVLRHFTAAFEPIGRP